MMPSAIAATPERSIGTCPSRRPCPPSRRRPRSRRAGGRRRPARPGGTARRSARSAGPSCASASIWVRPGMPLSSTKFRILRSFGSTPGSSSLQMNTMRVGVGAVRDERLVAVQHVAASPSRRAVRFMPPNASEPEPGSVIAQAPILSSVRRSSAQRSFCADRALADDRAAAVRPDETPIAVTMPGQYRQISMIGMICIAAASPPSLRAFFSPSAAASPRARASSAFLSRAIWCWKRCARHLVHAEGLEELAQDVVGRRVAVLELLDLRLDLGLHELPHHVADHLLGLGPIDHGDSPIRAGRDGLAPARSSPRRGCRRGLRTAASSNPARSRPPAVGE